MEKTFDSNEALDLIKIGLQSGSIKLLGATSVHAGVNGEKDAKYLLTLFNSLQKDPDQKEG